MVALQPIARIDERLRRLDDDELIVQLNVLGYGRLITNDRMLNRPQVFRMRPRTGDERQQLKWLAAAAALATVPVGLEIVDISGAWVVGATAVPFAAAVAILRFHLYEFDRIVHRALAYAIVTAVLAAIYTGGVLLLAVYTGGVLGFDQLLAPTLGPPSIAVAGATLLAVSVSRPLRRAVQAGVDRRFNRARYDAAATVEAFAGRLRHRLDLDDLAADLLATAQATMQPQAASVWLCPPGGKAFLPPAAAEAGSARPPGVVQCAVPRAPGAVVAGAVAADAVGHAVAAPAARAPMGATAAVRPPAAAPGPAGVRSPS